ncbi:transposase, Mutator family protein [Mycobacterium xenopi 3993]|nr:transposase, Mutator family protein [Mycobacterium xenopi 3993]
MGIFPDRASIIRLVGAVLAEQHDEWIEGRRYLGLDVLTRARTALTSTDEPPDSKPTPPSPDRLDCHPKGHAIERTLTPRHWAWPGTWCRRV